MPIGEIFDKDYISFHDFSIERVRFYQKVFGQLLETLREHIANLKQHEKAIINERTSFFSKFQELNIDKYDMAIFNKIKAQIEEFRIELQLSALNAKIKSLNMKEFSNIISVIGRSLEEEAIKVSLRFDEMKKVFDDVVLNLEHIESDMLSLKKVHFALSKLFVEIENFIDSEVLIKISEIIDSGIESEKVNELKILFKKLIDCYEDRLVNIYFLKNTKFYLNMREFKHNINIALKKIRLLMKDYENFVFKINYLTLITKIEVGKLKDNEFVMVINALDTITEEAKNIQKKLNQIFSYFEYIFKTIDKLHSNFSIKLRKLIYRDYFEDIYFIKEDVEASMKFLKNEIEKF